MPNPASIRKRRLRKTKAQLIDELESLERRAMTSESAQKFGDGTPPPSDDYLANQAILDLAKFPSENPNPVLRVTPEGDVLYANDAAQAVKGLLTGRNKSRLPNKLAKVVTKASRMGTIQESEFQSGDQICVFALTPVAGQSYLNIYGRDITKRKRAEAALSESEAQIRLLLNSTAEAIYGINMDGKCTFCNSACVAMLGYEGPEDLLGRHMHDLIHHTRPDGTPYPAKACLIYQAFRKGEGTHVDDEVMWRKDGTSFATEYWSFPIKRDDQVIGAVVTFLDITERKRAEETLREKTEFLQLNQIITRASNEATSVENAMQIALDRVCAQTGWPLGHVYLVDASMGDLVSARIWHQEDPKQFKTFRQVSEEIRFASGVGLPGRVLASSEPAWIVDVTKDRNLPRAKLATNIGIRSGAAFPVLVGKDVVAVLEFFSDKPAEPYKPLLEVMAQIGTQLGRVVERSRARAQLVAAMDAAMEATQAKSQFLANMSHELRTPLNAIIGFVRLVMRRSKDQLDPKQYGNLEKILSSSKHLLSLINDILDITKIEAGHAVVQPVRFELIEVIEDCLKTVESLAESRRLALVKQLEADLPELHTDKEKLRQILINLLSNAVKFTEEGSVTVAARHHVGNIVIDVTDTGIGIPEEALEDIFKEFSQVDESSTRRFGGTGLGLAISYHLVSLLGGQVRVESEVGVGSTFTVSLPARYVTPESADAAAARVGAAAPGEDKTVQAGANR